MGKNQVAKMLPSLTELVSGKRFTNNSVRPTSIRQMKRAGMEDREVASVSGHKDPNSLKHYYPGPGMAKMAKMAEAIANGKRKSVSATVTSSAETSISSSAETSTTSSVETSSTDFQFYVPEPSTSKSSEASSLNGLTSHVIVENLSENCVTVPLNELPILNCDPSNLVVIAQEDETILVEKNSVSSNMVNNSNTFSKPANENSLQSLLHREQDLTAQECSRLEKEAAQRRKLDEKRMALLELYLNSMK